MIYGEDSREQHQSRDTWAALIEVEAKDLPLLKRFDNSDVYILKIRENVCQRALEKFKKSFKEIEVCTEDVAFTDFVSFNKKIVMSYWDSKAHKNFVSLVNTCRYIKKEYNKDRLNCGAFLYLGKMISEPA